MEFELDAHAWKDLGPLPGADTSGFGRVRLVADQAGRQGVAKFIPQDADHPTEREIVIAELAAASGARNVIPVFDHGLHSGEWVIVTQRAEASLAGYLREHGGLEEHEAIRILQDIATALADLSDKAVHRDLKPANILKLDEYWCLTDFGISRLVDDATATQTWKGSGTAPYASPERFMDHRATPKSDIYSFGVIAFQLIEGKLPFSGPDFASEHMYSDVPDMSTPSPHLRALISAALSKSPATRPTPNQVLARLARAAQVPTGNRRSALAQVGALAEQKRAEEESRAARETRAENEAQARATLAGDTLRDIVEQFTEILEADAPSVRIATRHGAGRVSLSADLLNGRLVISEAARVRDWSGPFDVVASAQISVFMTTANRLGYKGRAHSLWFCDAKVEGEYAWFETAFMETFGGGQGSLLPFALDPQDAEQALANVIGTRQLAWPFVEIDHADADVFIHAWTERFALAAQDRLERPNHMPEQNPRGSYRTA